MRTQGQDRCEIGCDHDPTHTRIPWTHCNPDTRRRLARQRHRPAQLAEALGEINQQRRPWLRNPLATFQKRRECLFTSSKTPLAQATAYLQSVDSPTCKITVTPLSRATRTSTCPTQRTLLPE